MTDVHGTVTYTAAYSPYGERLGWQDGTQTPYGFAGEYTDSYTGEWEDSYIKLIYLRSRYYSPATGKFLTRDSWQGDYNRPLSLNRWAYVEGNPINFADPSGHIAECRGLTGELRTVCEQLYNDTAPDQVLDSLASFYGMQLAPGNHWEYVDYLSHTAGGAPVGGNTPRWATNPWGPNEFPPPWTLPGTYPPYYEDVYYDRNGQEHSVDDSAVYITSETFVRCGGDLSCIEVVMANEAGHSWFEFEIDTGAGHFPSDSLEVSFWVIPEELYILTWELNSPSIDTSNPATGIETYFLDMHYYFNCFYTPRPDKMYAEPDSVLSRLYQMNLRDFNLERRVYP
ncbi:MAG: RHS repeat-associated core domain-containing protein [Chloroflexota bacterium]